MATYQVTLSNQRRHFQQTIAVPDTESILNEASEYQIKMPFECVVGSCGMCQGQLLSGTVDQSEQMFLSESAIEQGVILTCVAKPTSDCWVEIELDNYL